MSWQNPYGSWPTRMRRKVGETYEGRKLYEIERGVMVIYDPSGTPPYNKPWWRAPFDGCFGGRKTPASMCSWIVVYPEWML